MCSFVLFLLGWLLKCDAILILEFFFFFLSFFGIKLVTFSLEPFRIFLVAYVLTFFSDVPFVDLIMMDTWGMVGEVSFSLEICILQLGKIFLSFFLDSFPSVSPVPYFSYLSFLNSLSSTPYSGRFPQFYLSDFYCIFISAMSS